MTIAVVYPRMYINEFGVDTTSHTHQLKCLIRDVSELFVSSTVSTSGSCVWCVTQTAAELIAEVVRPKPRLAGFQHLSATGRAVSVILESEQSKALQWALINIHGVEWK